MHWHQLRSQISQVFQVTSHIVGIFHSALRVNNSIVVPVREFLVEIHTAKMVL